MSESVQRNFEGVDNCKNIIQIRIFSAITKKKKKMVLPKREKF